MDTILDILKWVFVENLMLGILVLCVVVLGAALIFGIKYMRGNKKLNSATNIIGRHYVNSQESHMKINNALIEMGKRIDTTEETLKQECDSIRRHSKELYDEIMLVVSAMKETMFAIRDHVADIKDSAVENDASNSANIEILIRNMNTITEKITDLSALLRVIAMQKED